MSDTSPPSEAPPPRAETPAPKLPPPSSPANRNPSQRAWAAWLGVLLIVILALVGTSPYWAPALIALLPWSTGAAPLSQEQTQEQAQAQQQMAQQLDAIQQQLNRLAALNNRVTALENRPPPDASAAIAPLAAQVQQLASHLDQIDKQLAQLAHDAASNAQSPQRVLMIALAGLGNAIASSRPFAAELASVEALSQSRKDWTQPLQALEGPAKAGIPSTALLAQRFADDVAPAILRADATAPNGQQNLGAAMWARLRGLVIIRRVGGGGSGGDPADRAVDAAQAALDKGDLAGAAKALDALSGAAAKAAQPWLQTARERLDAEQTIAKLSRDLAGDMAAGASGG